MKKPKSDKKFFERADYLTIEEKKFFNLKFDDYIGQNQIKAKFTGEFREPKKGEWYLSGAEIQAYRAFNTLIGNKFFIARLVKIETKTIVTETEVLEKL